MEELYFDICTLLSRQYIFLSEALRLAGYADPAAFLRKAKAGKIPAIKAEGRWLVPIAWARELKEHPPKRGRPKVSAEHKRAVRARLERERRARIKAAKEAAKQAEAQADDTPEAPAEGV